MRTMQLSNAKVIAGCILTASMMTTGAVGLLAPERGFASEPHRKNVQETGRQQPVSQSPEPRNDPLSASQEASSVQSRLTIGDASPDSQTAATQVKQHRIQVITSVTNTSSIPVGRRCLVTLTSETDGRSQIVEVVREGKVSKATAEGITLTEAFARRTEKSPSAFAKLPILDRLFTNHGISKAKPGEEADIWIPAEKIRSITFAQDDMP